jgi:hypothetical protein
MRRWKAKDDPLEPMARVTRFVLDVAGIVLALGVVGVFLGQGFLAHRLCAADPGIQMELRPGQLAGLPGIMVTSSGVSFCTEHATAGQKLLNGLVQLSDLALLACVLFIVSRVIREAKRHGVFSDRLPRALRGLGWFIVLGGLVTMQVKASAQALLLNTLEPPGYDAYQPAWLGVGLWDMPWATLLAGVGVLTFARIIRIGVTMRRDLEETV